MGAVIIDKWVNIHAKTYFNTELHFRITVTTTIKNWITAGEFQSKNFVITT